MNKVLALAAILMIGLLFFMIKTTPLVAQTHTMKNGADLMTDKPEDHPTLTLAGGCFWCLESEFRAKDGILHTLVGYTGGDLKNPGYRDITTGKTGHAEAIEITYDPTKISEEQLLRFFFEKAHDPTQLNRQGVDVGTQYRSAVFYEGEDQKTRIESLIKEIDAGDAWKKPIVTTLEPATTFWIGEEYHQQYYEKYEQQNGKKHIRVLLKHK